MLTVTLFGHTFDPAVVYIVGGILGLLIVASVIGVVLKFAVTSEKGRRTVQNLNARMHAWWVMAAVFGGAVSFGLIGACVFFGLVSFFALREMITLAPTRRA